MNEPIFRSVEVTCWGTTNLVYWNKNCVTSIATASAAGFYMMHEVRMTDLGVASYRVIGLRTGSLVFFTVLMPSGPDISNSKLV